MARDQHQPARDCSMPRSISRTGIRAGIIEKRAYRPPSLCNNAQEATVLTPRSGPRRAATTDGQRLLLAHLDVVESVLRVVCRRHRLDNAETDDFSSHVKLKLVEGDYAILRKFERRSNIRTYLIVVIHRLFLDYRTGKWGKWRPSIEAKRLGPVAVMVERLLVRDGHSADEALEVLRTNQGVSIGRAELDTIAGRLPSRQRHRFESDEQLADVPSDDVLPDQAMAQRELRAASARVSKALSSIIAQLDVQDRLILTMRFADGRTIAEIATVLRLKQKPLYRRIDNLLQRIRAELQRQGVDSAEASVILARCASGID